MQRSRWLTTLGFLVLAAPAACGESDSRDASGAECASSAQCPPSRPTCTDSGRCIAAAAGECETDADCSGDAPFCNTLSALIHTCDTCRGDGDCPSEAPVCAPAWEGGLYCAECRGGDSSRCDPGTWCTPAAGETAGGECRVANCASEPASSACWACLNENAAPCVNAGGECDATLATLRGCYANELPGWTPDDCPTGIVPAERGCTPAACFDEADAFDACLFGCGDAADRCEPS